MSVVAVMYSLRALDAAGLNGSGLPTCLFWWGTNPLPLQEEGHQTVTSHCATVSSNTLTWYATTYTFRVEGNGPPPRSDTEQCTGSHCSLHTTVRTVSTADHTAAQWTALWYSRTCFVEVMANKNTSHPGPEDWSSQPWALLFTTLRPILWGRQVTISHWEVAGPIGTPLHM